MIQEKRGILIGVIILFIIVILLSAYFLFFNQDIYRKILTCGDGTFNDECSLRKPYFCLNQILAEKASVCGCPEILTENKELCISKYQTNPKNITLKYVLRGDEKEMDFVVYGGMVDYITSLPKSISYNEGEKPLRRDFKLRNINEKEQKELLLPLVTKIQNLAGAKEEQARIAVSIIQKIPFGESNEVIIIGNNQVNYSRYPYEVLYNMQGVCGEKAELLVFLLKEIGYGVVIFYYPAENHETVGIKCPVKYSLDNSGYCFIETTGPSIITNDENDYIGAGKLLSEPEMILISEGDSLGEDLYEYKDAKDWRKINKIIEEKGRIGWIKSFKFKELKEKYGLEI